MEDGPVTVTVDLNAPPPVPVVPVAPVAEVPGFTGKPGNFQADMAALLAEQSKATPAVPVAPAAPVEVPAPVIEAPAQPEITDTATAPVIVPEKFKDANGDPDPAKIEKSTAEAQAALAKYLTMEKELRRKMNEVNGLKSAPQIMPATPEATAPDSFEAQIEADIAKHGAGKVLARLFEASKEVAKKEVLSDVMADREERAEIKSRRELEEIGKYDQEVLTPQGLERLAQIRAERPWLNQSPNPTEAAYEVYLAEKVKTARRTGQVQPTPKGLTAKAPPTPVGPAPRVVAQPKGPDLSTKDAIDAHLKTLNADQEREFWKSRGLKFK